MFLPSDVYLPFILDLKQAPLSALRKNIWIFGYRGSRELKREILISSLTFRQNTRVRG